MPDVDLTRQIHIRVIDPTTMKSRELQHIVAGSVAIEEIIISRDIIFGQLYASKAEFQIYDDTSDLVKNQIFIYALEGTSTAEIPIFTGIIDSCKSDRLTTYRDIVAYDRSYELSKTNVAKWWNTFWESQTTATILQLRTSLLREYGVTYKNKSLPNDGISIQCTYKITSISFNNMLKMLTELSCCFPHFGRDGVLEFITLNPNSTATELDGTYEGDTSDFEEAPIKKYDDVAVYDVPGNLRYSVAQLTSEDYLNAKHNYDNIYQQSLVAYQEYSSWMSQHHYTVKTYEVWLAQGDSTHPHDQGTVWGERLRLAKQELDQYASQAGGTNPYSIKNSLIIQDLDDLTVEAIANNMMSAIDGIEYKASNINIIVGGASLKLGEKVSADGNEFYVFQNSWSNSLLVDQNIQADGIVEDDETEVETVFGDVVIYKTMEETIGQLGFNVNVLSNGEAIVVHHDDTAMTLCNTEVMTKSETRVLIDIEVLCTVETKEDEIQGIDIDTYREHDCMLYFKYYWDDALIEVRQPIEQLQDGQHIVNLHFSLKVSQDVRHLFRLTLESHGGDITIEREGVFATIAGQALVKDADTNDIRCSDEVAPLNITGNLLGVFTDSGVVNLPHMDNPQPVETISAINLLDNLFNSGGFTDSIHNDEPIMVFAPWVNNELIQTTVTDYDMNTGWQGFGDTQQGTAAEIVTCDMENVDHVTTIDHAAVFYASFDSGTTWVTYSEGAWRTGHAAMIDTNITAITPQQWALGGSKVRLKVLLGHDCTLYDINVYGANVYEEEEND